MRSLFFFSVFVLALAVSAGTEIDTIIVQGLPYGNRHNGVFVISGSYNGSPAYKSLKDTRFQMYKRKTGRWVLDFNAISEEHSGTVAFSTSKVNRPWLSAWKNGVITEGAGIDRITLAGLPYSKFHNRVFIVDSLYNGFPVYKSVKDKRFRMYRRSNGKWVLDFNTISEEHSGTVAYSTSSGFRPWLATWKNAEVSYLSAPVPTIYITGLAYASRHNGAFTLTGTYNDKPVYTSKKNKWKMYMRKNGIWALDANAIDEEWSGTVAYSTKAFRPWLGTWKNGEVTTYSK